ncbi:hypothetical protein V2J09_007637 [Rumex salicifolius]
MDQHRPSFPNPGNNRYPAFFSPSNPHHNHHQHHLPPPPSLPPPPPARPIHQSPISLPPQPPPPNSFHHHHGHSSYQFVNSPHRGRHQQPPDPNFVNYHRDNNHNLNNRHVDFVQAPRRASERPVVVDRRRDRPFTLYRGHDGDPGGHAVWGPSPRVLIDATPPPPPPITRRIPRVYIEHEHSPHRPTYQPVDRFRNDQDGGSRVRKGGNSDFWFRVDELPRERRDDFSRNGNFHHDRSQRDVDRDIHRKEFVPVTGELFSRSVPQKELIMQGRDNGMNGNLMWESRPRGTPHSPTEKRNRAIDDGNRFYEKGKNHVQESERYEDRDRWEDAQDYNITPSKKQKKKNVLLRIQPALPSYSNNCEHTPSLCKDREPSQLPDLRLSIKEREGSPVVSFKSNLLIVASSSAGAVAEDVSVHRDDKNRNELNNKDDLLLPTDAVEKVALKSDSDYECEKGPGSFRKEEIHLEKKPKSPTYLKKVKSFVSHYLPAGNSDAPSHRTECLSKDKEPSKSPNGKVLNKSYAASGSSKESSPSSSRKRKSTNPHISLSSSQVLEKDLGSISVDNMVNSLSFESSFDEGLKDSGKGLTTDVNVSGSTQVALTASHVKSTAVESSKAVDGECANDSVSSGASAPKKKRRRVRKRRPCSSGQLSDKPIENQVDDIGAQQDVQRSNCDGMINTVQKGSGSDTVINYNSNLCLDVVSVPLQLGFAEGSSDAAFSLGGSTNVLPAIVSTNSSERPLSFSRTGGVDSASCSGGARQSQTSASLEEGEIEESMEANPSEQDNKSTQVSVLEEFFISDSSDVSHCKIAIAGAADNVVPQSSEQLINGSDDNAVIDASNLSCTGKFYPSIDAGVGGIFTESEMSKGDLSLFPAEGSLTKNVRKRKISELHRGTEKFDALSLTLGCSIDSDPTQDNVAGPDAQLELYIGDSITTNECEGGIISSLEAEVSVNPCVDAYPSEVVTSSCEKNNKVLSPEHGSSHGTSTEICKKVACSDASTINEEVAQCSTQVVLQSSVGVGLSLSEFASQLDLSHRRDGLDLNDDASAQISAGLKLAEEICGKGGSNFVHPGTADVSGIPDEKQTSSFSESVRCLQGNETLLMNGAINGYSGFGVDNGRSKYDTWAAGDCSLQNKCSDQNADRQETPILNADHDLLIRDLESDINDPVKGELSSQSEHLMLSSESASDERVTNSSPRADILSLVDHPENLSATTSMEMFDVPDFNGNPDGKLFSAQRKSSGKSMKEGLLSSSSSTPINIVSSEMACATDGIVNSSVKSMPFLQASQTSKDLFQNSSNDRKKQTRNKNETNHASSKALSSRLSYVPSSGRRHTTVVKSRTWHRTDNPTSILPGQNSVTTFVPQQKKTFSQTVRAQSNSYVRKGNSLLRNPVTAVTQAPKTPEPSASQLNLPASDDYKNTLCEVPVNLSSPCNIDSSNCNPALMGDSRSPPVADSTMVTENEPEEFPEDMPKSSGNSEFDTKSFEDQGSLNQSNQAASPSRRMVYIKRKSNQLVASPNTSTEISASNKDIPALMSDVYYKSTKNQLVRATPETNQAIADPIDEGRRVFRSYATKRDPNRVTQKIPKSRKFSLVWKLCSRSPKKGVNSLRCQQVLPHLLPWKRATYRRSLVRTSADLFKNSPLRKMHIIYKRSGFSLRRSKVVSLAGSSLKWSISLERRSKKVDKEATSAVAMLKKEKKEKSSFSVINSGTQSKRNSLHEEQPRSGSGHQVKNAVKSSIPRRLHIRNDDYVRIGNGNQLIRNPKRRNRILASEKVRWSLHTARMRLAKKRKYCQFFTRFGKCNKEEGKCPYIHDPSKTAVCTKFLNGLCSDPKCKLTHKVIPERMPDCSFFLHGLCSNESCPYRHVSVNPKAAICESFLKGYCSEGNECRKKHSYMCPVYEATGDCPEGSKCKLYHSKKGKDNNNKKKNTKHQKNTRGRYFGSNPATSSNETESEAYKKRLESKDDGIILEDGALADYISLDVSDEEEEAEQEDEASRETNLSWGEQPSLVVDDPDELIKPFRLLRMMSQAAEGSA